MRTGLAIFLLFLATAAHADLAAKFKEEQALDPNTTPISAKVAEAVRARPVVMIAGIMNEWIPGYFADNEKTLKKDFKQKETHRYFPKSAIEVEKNSVLVAGWIRETYEKYGRKPVLVLAHSKGANETLLAVLNDPTLLRDGIIDRLVFIQSAVRGSHVADMLLNNDSGDWPAAKPFQWLFHDWKGLWSMTPRLARPMFENALAAADPADVQLLSDKLYWVEAEKDRNKCSWQLQAMHLFVETFWGDSDGVMLPEDQHLAGLGTDLGTLEGDHFDLTERNVGVVATPTRYRRAFTRALMRELFE